MKGSIRFILSIVCITSSLHSDAQFITFFDAFSPNEVRADRFYDKAKFNQALELYQLCLKKDPTNQFMKLKLAKTLFRLHKTKEAESMFSGLLRNPKVIRPDDRFEYIQCLIENGKIEMGKTALNQFVRDNPANEAAKSLQSRFAKTNKFYKDSALYETKRLIFNDKSSDFSPSFFRDGIVFVTSKSEPLINFHSGGGDSTDFYDLYKVRLDHDSILEKPKPLDRSLNSYFHQGPATFFDNDQKMIFTSNKQDGVGRSKNLLLYMAERDSQSDKWKNVNVLPFIHNSISYAHPSMSPSGNVLVFSSDLPGGQGGADLFKIAFNDGQWGVPINLGKSVNTKANEFFPFLLNDTILYFSSDGWPGLGKLDMFRVNISEEYLGTPENLGVPLNSTKDDFGLVFDKTETYGYFSSNRIARNDDIFYFTSNYILFSLKIVDDLTKKPLEKYACKMVDEVNDEMVIGMEDNKNLIFKLIPNRKYTLSIQSPAFKPYVKPVWTKSSKERKIELTAEMGRKIKNFIHATVTRDEDDQPETQTQLILVNVDSLSNDTLKRFFDKSEFDFEVDNSTRYMLVSQKDNRIAIEEIKPTKNKKASSVVYTPLRLKKFYPFEIKGTVKDKETKSLLAGYLVTFRDMLLGNLYQVMTDDNGEFTFTGYTYTKYEIATENAENRSVFSDIDYVKAHGQIFELILK